MLAPQVFGERRDRLFVFEVDGVETDAVARPAARARHSFEVLPGTAYEAQQRTGLDEPTSDGLTDVTACAGHHSDLIEKR
jgi:hypothetical protein